MQSCTANSFGHLEYVCLQYNVISLARSYKQWYHGISDDVTKVPYVLKEFFH
jgi:hypothetical protein